MAAPRPVKRPAPPPTGKMSEHPLRSKRRRTALHGACLQRAEVPRGWAEFMDTTSVSLLQRLRQPVDHQAWSRFVDLYTPLVYSLARQVGLQESDAADLAQEVFAVLVRKMPSFTYDGQRSFRAW